MPSGSVLPSSRASRRPSSSLRARISSRGLASARRGAPADAERDQLGKAALAAAIAASASASRSAAAYSPTTSLVSDGLMLGDGRRRRPTRRRSGCGAVRPWFNSTSSDRLGPSRNHSLMIGLARYVQCRQSSRRPRPVRRDAQAYPSSAGAAIWLNAAGLSLSSGLVLACCFGSLVANGSADSSSHDASGIGHRGPLDCLTHPFWPADAADRRRDARVSDRELERYGAGWNAMSGAGHLYAAYRIERMRRSLLVDVAREGFRALCQHAAGVGCGIEDGDPLARCKVDHSVGIAIDQREPVVRDQRVKVPVAEQRHHHVRTPRRLARPLRQGLLP